jgi:hypothetical protein
MKEDLAVVKKIAGDTGQAEPKVRHDFFMQLQAYKGTLRSGIALSHQKS